MGKLESKTRQLAQLRTDLHKRQAVQAQRAAMPAKAPTPVMLPPHLAASLAPQAASPASPQGPVSPQAAKPPGRMSFSKGARTWISAARAAAAAAKSPKAKAAGQGVRTALKSVVELIRRRCARSARSSRRSSDAS